MRQDHIPAWHWTLQKQEHAPHENDDACRVQFTRDGNDSAAVLLVASDGATGAVYSGRWAQALVAAAELDWPRLAEAELAARLAPVRQSFRPINPDREKDVPWYVREKFRTEGSQATLLIASVSNGPTPGLLDVHAVSVGDTCLLLLHVADDEYRYTSFPIASSKDFGTHPVLMRNRLPNAVKFERFEATLQPDDLLLLGTDAIAKWMLQCLETGNPALVFEALRDLMFPVDEPAPPAEEPPAELTPAAPQKRSALEELSHWLDTLLHRDKAAPPPLPQPHQAPPAERSPHRRFGDFSAFVAWYRGPEAKPQMHNDDCTLIVCCPVGSGDGTSLARDILSKHADRAAALPIRRRKHAYRL